MTSQEEVKKSQTDEMHVRNIIHNVRGTECGSQSIEDSHADISILLGKKVLQGEKQRQAYAKTARKKLLHECAVLRPRLQDCSVNFLAKEEDKFTVSDSSLSDAIDLLSTSDNRIDLLLAEVSKKHILLVNLEMKIHQRGIMVRALEDILVDASP